MIILNYKEDFIYYYLFASFLSPRNTSQIFTFEKKTFLIPICPVETFKNTQHM